MASFKTSEKQFSFARIIKSGPHTTTQDLGRKGHQHTGYSAGGAADEYAFRWANKLLGNAQDSTTLEIIFGPFEIIFYQPCVIALTGATANAILNDIHIKLWQTHQVNAGDKLKLTSPKSGLINYLAIMHGIRSPHFLGSSSIVVREKTGPNNGKILADDHLICYTLMADDRTQLDSDLQPLNKSESKKTSTDIYVSRSVHPIWIPNYTEEIEINLFLHSQYHLFEEHVVTKLFQQDFMINPHSNKMGYKLNGDPITLSQDHHIQLSEAIGYGAVQIPPDGQPIILLKDRQTIGGYPKIGAISQLDAFKLSQRRPGQTVRFKKGDIVKERKELKHFFDFFNH